MAEDARSARHVGKVTDPAVREDGIGEPQVESGELPPVPPPPPARGSSAPPSFPPPPPSSKVNPPSGAPVEVEPTGTTSTPPEFARTGHPVRDRLLAKAAAAEAAKGAAPSLTSGSVPSPRFGSLGELVEELDEIATPKGAQAPQPVRIAGTALSSSSVALFGTLIGLAAIASLFAVLIQWSPRDPQSLPAPLPVAMPQPTAAALIPSLPSASAVAESPAPREPVKGPWRIRQAGSGEQMIAGKIGNQPFLRAVQEAGIEKSQAYRAYTALKGEKNLDRCRPSDRFAALLDESTGKLKAFEYIVSKEEVYQARTGKDGLLKGQTLDLQVRKRRVQGAIVMSSGSFAQAAVAARFEKGLGSHLNKALEGHTSVEQFKAGDRLRVVAQEITVLGEFSRYSGIEALEYLPVSGKRLRIYYLPSRKKYYDAKGRAPGEGGWRRPVKGAPITSKFNLKRMHPILKKRMPHNGTDFGAPTGTPIYATLGGKIITRGTYGPNGNYIAIQHANDYQSGYSHLSRFEPNLKVGDKVRSMQVIGYVGTTGRSTGPHLHFSIKKKGKYIDPESLNLDALTTLPASDREALNTVRRRYDAMLEAVPLPAAVGAPAPIVAGLAEPSMGPAAAPPPSNPASGVVAGQAPAVNPAVLPGPSPAPSVVAPVVAVTPVAPVPTVAAAAVAPTPAPAAAPATGFQGLYLSDKELLKLQSSVDEGEVDQ